MVRGEGSRLRLFALQPISRGPYSPRSSAAKPDFDRAQHASAAGRRPDDEVATAMLSQHLHTGNIRRIARGVFASVLKHVNADKWVMDYFLTASRLRRGCVGLLGCAHTDGQEVQGVAPRGPGAFFETADFVCHFVTPPHGFAPPGGVMTVDRLGRDVRVTTIERTIARRPARPL